MTQSISRGFVQISESITTYFLDTCVWSHLVESTVAAHHFRSRFESENLLAGLSVFTVFELTRAARLLRELDSIFYGMRTNIWMPLLYDELFDLELSSYPNDVKMRWMPLSLITDEENPEVMTKFATDPRVQTKRDEYLRFGASDFLDLERFKKNFPPAEDGSYSTEQAELFAWSNTVDFLARYFHDFLIPFRGDASSLDTRKLASVHMRSLFLFYKYYIHGQSPAQSDFMDFAHVSYAPYVDYYVTERNAANVLRHIAASNNMISNTEPIVVTDFIRELERGA